MYKKMDEYGADHDAHITKAVKMESQRLSQEIPINVITDASGNQCTEEAINEKTKDAKAEMRQRQLQPAELPDPEMDEFVMKINKQLQEKATKKSATFQVTNEDIVNCSREQESLTLTDTETLATPHPFIPKDMGRKITFDNIDFYVQPHEMTESKQNLDVHWVAVMSTENRISSKHLSDDKPDLDKLAEFDNGMCFPSDSDHRLQKQNYVALIARIAVTHVDCLKPLEDVVSKHIKHKYSSSSCKPTNTVSNL